MKVAASLIVLAGCAVAYSIPRDINCVTAQPAAPAAAAATAVAAASAGQAKAATSNLMWQPPQAVADRSPAQIIQAAAIADASASASSSGNGGAKASASSRAATDNWPKENGCLSLHTGDGTVFDYAPGQFLACGVEGNSKTDNWFAVSHLYTADWVKQGSNICGKEFWVEYNGKKVKGRLGDKCMGCKEGDIDLSYSMWNQLTDDAFPSRYTMKWYPA